VLVVYIFYLYSGLITCALVVPISSFIFVVAHRLAAPLLCQRAQLTYNLTWTKKKASGLAPSPHQVRHYLPGSTT